MKNKTWLIELLLVLIIAFGAYSFLRSRNPVFHRLSWQTNVPLLSRPTPAGHALTLPQLFAGHYQGQRVTVVGQVKAVPAVCQKQICPSTDRCCGCPHQVALQMSGEYLLQLSAVCSRQGCGYSCGDWQKNQTYEVTGTLTVSWPNQYRLVVDSQKLLPRSFGPFASFSTFFSNLWSLLRNLTSEGEYLIL
jgi:hypothetical protein